MKNEAVIFNAVNNTKPFIDILSEVPEGNGYIWTGRRFIQKTGWRSSKMIDWRHIGHCHHRAELKAYAAEMGGVEAIYRGARLAIVPLHDKLAEQNAFQMALQQRPLTLAERGSFSCHGVTIAARKRIDPDGLIEQERDYEARGYW